jgi:hypothetical protein
LLRIPAYRDSRREMRCNMKYGFSICRATIALFALTAAFRLAAQDNKRHHYQLIDMGTFGGPASFVNPPFNGNPELSSRGVSAGGSATPVATTSISNLFVCGGLDGVVPNVFHGFEWQNGVVTDLGAPPGNNSSIANWITGKRLNAGVSRSGNL